MSKTIRFVSVLGLAAFAAASQAVYVQINSATATGGGANTTGTTFNSTVTGVNQSDSPFGFVLTGSTVAITLNGVNSRAVYTTPTSGGFTVLFNGTASDFGAGSFGISSGTTITNTSGAFNLYSGSMGLVFSGTVTNPGANGSGGFSLGGNVFPSPEPTSLAALGVGAVALLRRRRKA